MQDKIKPNSRTDHAQANLPQD